jgi:hypothetical protein
MFGNEMEVSAMNQATKSKTQVLENEYLGTQVRENVLKKNACQNYWKFVLAANANEAEPVVTPSTLTL